MSSVAPKKTRDFIEFFPPSTAYIQWKYVYAILSPKIPKENDYLLSQKRFRFYLVNIKMLILMKADTFYRYFFIF